MYLIKSKKKKKSKYLQLQHRYLLLIDKCSLYMYKFVCLFKFGGCGSIVQKSRFWTTSYARLKHSIIPKISFLVVRLQLKCTIVGFSRLFWQTVR